MRCRRRAATERPRGRTRRTAGPATRPCAAPLGQQQGRGDSSDARDPDDSSHGPRSPDGACRADRPEAARRAPGQYRPPRLRGQDGPRAQPRPGRDERQGRADRADRERAPDRPDRQARPDGADGQHRPHRADRQHRVLRPQGQDGARGGGAVRRRCGGCGHGPILPTPAGKSPSVSPAYFRWRPKNLSPSSRSNHGVPRWPPRLACRVFSLLPKASNRSRARRRGVALVVPLEQEQQRDGDLAGLLALGVRDVSPAKKAATAMRGSSTASRMPRAVHPEYPTGPVIPGRVRRASSAVRQSGTACSTSGPTRDSRMSSTGSPPASPGGGRRGPGRRRRHGAGHRTRRRRCRPPRNRPPRTAGPGPPAGAPPWAGRCCGPSGSAGPARRTRASTGCRGSRRG